MWISRRYQVDHAAYPGDAHSNHDDLVRRNGGGPWQAIQQLEEEGHETDTRQQSALNHDLRAAAKLEAHL